MTSRVRMTASLALLATLCSTVLHAQSSFYLKPNDRVVFYGDSITDQRLYTTFVETFVVTRFPKHNVWFTHSGWGGDRVTGGGGGPVDTRLTRDVIAYRPTVMTIMLGMNDASYRPFDDAIFATYKAGYEHIVEKMRAAVPGLRMTLIQPSPFDDVTRPPSIAGGYNSVLVRYGETVKDIAARNGLHSADLNGPVVDSLHIAKNTDAPTALKLIPDRVHPLEGGQILMAAALLKAWNAPAEVSYVEIDAAGSKVTSARNARVSAVEGGLKWRATDGALPFPINWADPAISLAVRSSDIMQGLNQQVVKVTGLKAGTYSFKIDDAVVGEFSAEQLAGGVNLAAQQTPMAAQAMAVHRLTLEHNRIHFNRWRDIEVKYGVESMPGVRKAMMGLDALEQDMVAQQRQAAQPKEHTFELVAK